MIAHLVCCAQRDKAACGGVLEPEPQQPGTLIESCQACIRSGLSDPDVCPLSGAPCHDNLALAHV